MRIRRQPQLNPQATRAENPIDRNVLSLAVVSPKPSSPSQLCAEDIHVSIADLSMIYSASKFRASVNWLDRLRAAKGFSVDSDRHIEELLSSRACSPEHTQSCHPKLDDVTCLKNENTLTTEGSCKGMVDTRDLVPSRTPDSNILNAPLPPQALSCNSGNAHVESRHSRGLEKYQPLESAENVMTGSRAVSPGVDKSAWSRSPGIPSPASQDSNAEASVSQLYFNTFADLFCIDFCSLNSLLPMDGKKRQRKQEKPKVCSTFADPGSACAAVASPQLRPSESDLQATPQLDLGNPASQSEEATAVVDVDVLSSTPEEEGHENIHVQQGKTPDKVLRDENKEKDELDLGMCPMNELFIIDTSLPGWKAKKYITRKGNGWRIRDRGVSAPPVKCASAEGKTKDLKKRPGTPPAVNMKNGPTEVPRQCGPSTCKDKMETDAANSGECPVSTEHVARLWSTAPHTHIRSSRKRRKTILPEAAAAPPKETPETSSTTGEPVCAKAEIIEKPTAVTSDVPAHEEMSASDHPADQPKEGIAFSVYQVFMQAGKSGLTPREAVSRILEQGLPGLHEGGVVPRVEVLKIVANSPYFMPLEESKYILCSALVGDEEGIKAAGGKASTQVDGQQKESSHGQNSSDNAESAEQQGLSHYGAACTAIRKARTGKTRRKPSLGGSYLAKMPASREVRSEINVLSSKKRLKSVKQDAMGLGNPCNRSDGKGWHCPLRAKVGYLLCDHHLDRLRTRVKSHIKPGMLSLTRASMDERKRITNGSWMVRKVVERGSVGQPSQASSETDAYDKLPINASEMSGSRISEV